jgi:transposase InsO family protein
MKQLRYPVKKCCKVLDVSVSGYYAWLKRPPSDRTTENESIKNRIKDIFQKHRMLYGRPRIAHALRDEGIPCSRPRTARLMRQLKIRAKTKRKFKRTTDSQHGRPVAPCLLGKNVVPMQPDAVWVSNITYVPTNEGCSTLR